MRITPYVSLLGAAALAAVAGCTVKTVEQPAFAGPSTMAHSITMVADRDTLTQNGLDFTDIRITALGPDGQSENIPLRAQVTVDGVPQDFGTLSTKTPITPTTIRYTAPPPSTVASAQTPQTVTIQVTPANVGDFRGEVRREIDIRLLPQGVILPSNPNLTAAFTFTPAAPQVMQTVSFDASTSTNNGSACLSSCIYSWNFGDGTSGTGQTTTHQFRTINNFNVTLTVTDGRGATALVTKQVPVAAGTPPTAVFTISPANPGVGQDVFFNATQSAPAAGRTITSYDWSFGDGTTASGVVQSHKFTAPGAYQIQLTTTDDAGSIGRSSPTSLQVGPTVGALPVATMTCISGSAGRSVPVSCNATASTPGSGSTIVSFTYNWGVGDPDEVSPNPVQSHLYRAPGTFTVTMTVLDSLGRTAVAQQSVTVAP
jgi:PKD repeat protein